MQLGERNPLKLATSFGFECHIHQLETFNARNPKLTKVQLLKILPYYRPPYITFTTTPVVRLHCRPFSWLHAQPVARDEPWRGSCGLPPAR